ncbi:MAG: glycerol kinase GlpK [Desulfobacterales bacterium]|nr:glycerol kinase GlpK [Desulfobacterales bacterium]MDX2513246.1 glycerol kinase GlpK [Desulfobacterales bacterium]
MSELILSIDQGTTGTTVLLIDENLNVRGKGYREFRQIYPEPGWVEHDPEDIWASVLASLDEALQTSGVAASKIVGIGITNQRETNLIWDRETGRPFHNAIVWQCRRTSGIVEELKTKGYEALFQKRTGLLLDPYFSGTKLKWQLDNITGLRKEVEAKRAIAGTIDTFLTWKLTDGAAHVTDVTNASRTLLMDLETLSWDDELCSILSTPKTMLPEIRSCSEIYGHTRNVPGLPDGIPICGMAGDQQAALFGQACFEEGEAKCTYGTGGFLLMNTGATPVSSKNRLLTTVAWQVKNTVTYALEGSAFIAGSAVKWLRDGLQFVDEASQIEALANQVTDSGGVTVVPGFVGLGAPHWRSEARGLITGLTLGTNRAHLARATLEGIALQNVEILQAMIADSNHPLVQLKVDGGASANNLLMQMQADFLGCRIVRPEMVETTALGAAFLAGIGAGVWNDFDDIARAWKMDREFQPGIDDKERLQVLERWREAVLKA